MKPKQRFLIAKYAPDVRRMEPRNIGVILWANGMVESKFLGVADAGHIVNEVSTYTRWIEFWKRLAGEKTIAIRGKPAVAKKDPEFLDAIQSTEEGNYLLFDAGHVLTEVRKESLKDAAEFLFAELVLPPGKSHETTPRENLAEACEKLLAETGISAREDFAKDYQLKSSISDVDLNLDFDYAIGDGKPDALFQTVRLNRRQSVTSAAFMFEQARTHVPKENLGAVLSASDENLDDSDISSAIRLMKHYATVVNLAKYEEAKATALQIAQPVLRFGFDRSR